MPRALPFAILLMCLAACSQRCDQQDTSNKVTPSSSADAHQPIVDDDYKFRLERPGPDWKVLDEQNARNLNADALAALVDKSGRFVIIIAEELPGISLDEYAQLLSDGMQLVDKVVEEEGATTHHGREARRTVIRGKMQGVDFRFAATVVRHGDFLFQILAWASAAHPQGTPSDLLQLASSLTFLDGKPTGRSDPISKVESADGPGWHVRGGVFESAVSRLRVAPPEGWRLVVGAALEHMNQDAEIGLSRSGPDVYAVVLSDKAPPGEAAQRAEREQLLTDTAVNLGATGDGEPLSLSVLGGPKPFSRWSIDGPYEYVYGVFTHHGMTVQLLGWYVRSMRDRSLAELRRAFQAVSDVPDAAFAALRVQLENAPAVANVVGPTYALRRGTYRNFARGIRFVQPDGLWAVHAGDVARMHNEDAELFIHDKSRGLYALLITEDAMDLTPESFERALAEDLRMTSGFQPAPSSLRASFTGAPTRILEGPATFLGSRQILATTVHAGQAVQLLIWGHSDHIAKNRASVESLIRGLQIGTKTEAVTVGSRHRDLRMGFSVDVMAGWSKHQLSIPNEGMTGYAAWKKGGSVAIVMAICALDASQDDKWFQGFIDQMMRDTMGKVGRSKPNESAARLANEPATRVSWISLGERADAIYASRDRTLYAILVTGRNSDNFDGLVRSFRFED